MRGILEHPGQAARWQALAADGRPARYGLFAGYRSQVDWPGAHFRRELAGPTPRARAIHTVRPEAGRWRSQRTPRGSLTHGGHRRAGRRSGGASTIAIPPSLADRDWTRAVRAALPPDRLLVIGVADGREPLCRFLEVPISDEPFPHRNLAADVRDALGGQPTAAEACP